MVSLMSGGPGQQQSQSNGFDTGEWVGPPVLFRSAAGLVLQIKATRGDFFIALQSSGMSMLDRTPSLAGANVLSLQIADAEPAHGSRPMEPMKPMEPMTLNPMEMRMGDMYMGMGRSEAQPQPRHEPRAKRFCTQCGKPVGSADRFCAYCGTRLTPSEE
jgi:zinc-ribbon domain